jgi:hypothetical protein
MSKAAPARLFHKPLRADLVAPVLGHFYDSVDCYPKRVDYGSCIAFGNEILRTLDTMCCSSDCRNPDLGWTACPRDVTEVLVRRQG